ncbi:hypothetical protein CDAR_463731 [Caerostris darwini]|uniref:Uncharacterized protein n=1 Tax=Caerostris darwini TaxID=1538125 RepID=A0AAV4MXK0_9ARAC|nr:hypothetical protein CDAR_463731 [Caerostris darwini]
MAVSDKAVRNNDNKVRFPPKSKLCCPIPIESFSPGLDKKWLWILRGALFSCIPDDKIRVLEKPIRLTWQERNRSVRIFCLAVRKWATVDKETKINPFIGLTVGKYWKGIETSLLLWTRVDF